MLSVMRAILPSKCSIICSSSVDMVQDSWGASVVAQGFSRKLYTI